ncbi:hypothetical protein Rs2_38564 [Raphanus sativus]|nr:hypothetical protein Rs2_38564 [Raphanus sativus]
MHLGAVTIGGPVSSVGVFGRRSEWSTRISKAEGGIDFAPVEHLPECVPVERSPELPPKDKDIEFEDHDFPVDDSPLPGWDPSLGFGDGSGSSDTPITNFDDFFSGLPDHPNPPPSWRKR